MRGSGPCEPPYGDLFVGRSLLVNGRVLKQHDNGTEAGLDISGGTYVVRFRAYLSPDAAATLVDEAISASADGGSSGYYEETLLATLFGSTPYSGLWFEEVLVDTGTTDLGTKTQKAEHVLRWWKQPLLDRPAA